MIGQGGVEIFNTLFPNDGSCISMFGQINLEDAAGNIEANANDRSDGTDNDDNLIVQQKLEDVLKVFEDYCLPRKNVAMEAFKFIMIVQKEKQLFGSFETELRTQLQYCEFQCSNCHTSYADRMLRDCIIIGVQDKKLQLKLLDGKDDPLPKIVETCKVFEAAADNKQLLDRKSINLTEIKTIIELKEMNRRWLLSNAIATIVVRYSADITCVTVPQLTSNANHVEKWVIFKNTANQLHPRIRRLRVSRTKKKRKRRFQANQ